MYRPFSLGACSDHRKQLGDRWVAFFRIHDFPVLAYNVDDALLEEQTENFAYSVCGSNGLVSINDQ